MYFGLYGDDVFPDLWRAERNNSMKKPDYSLQAKRTRQIEEELWGVPKMIAVLERLDRCRSELMEAADELFRTLANGMPRPDRDDFIRFYRAGGISAEQYRAWLRGQFKDDDVPGRRFMRLVIADDEASTSPASPHRSE
jgi:hypothetical protein